MASHNNMYVKLAKSDYKKADFNSELPLLILFLNMWTLTAPLNALLSLFADICVSFSNEIGEFSSAMHILLNHVNHIATVSLR